MDHRHSHTSSPAHHHRHARSREGSVVLHVGDLHASAVPVTIKTVLGSCISACMYDPSTAIGGMNHFMLPGDVEDQELSTRYGINAMEVLINEMMKLGAERKRMKAKVFGGGDIFQAHHPLMQVGARNIAFVRNFLHTEAIAIVGERVGGNSGLIVHYHSATFEVFVKPISTTRFKQTEDEEVTYRRKITRDLNDRKSDNVTLF